MRRRIGRLVEVDHSVPHVLLQLTLQRGAPARNGHVVRRSALEVVVVAEQQGPLGRVQSRLGGLGPDHVLGGGLRGGAIIAFPFPLGLLRALLFLLDVACGGSSGHTVHRELRLIRVADFIGSSVAQGPSPKRHLRNGYASQYIRVPQIQNNACSCITGDAAIQQQQTVQETFVITLKKTSKNKKGGQAETYRKIRNSGVLILNLVWKTPILNKRSSLDQLSCFLLLRI